MNLKELNQMQMLTKRIGIITFRDLYNFKQREMRPDETLLQALIRYNNELGEDFEIRR